MVPGVGLEFRAEAVGFGAVGGGLGVERGHVRLDHVTLLSGQETYGALIRGPGVPLGGVRPLKGCLRASRSHVHHGVNP
jgi:hypothetical protein